MKLFLFEIRKLLGERLSIALPALLLLSFAIVCSLAVEQKRADPSGVSAQAAAESFFRAYSGDPAELEGFKERYYSALSERMAELQSEYGEDLPDLRDHPELLSTHVFSPYISDRLHGHKH